MIFLIISIILTFLGTKFLISGLDDIGAKLFLGFVAAFCFGFFTFFIPHIITYVIDTPDSYDISDAIGELPSKYSIVYSNVYEMTDSKAIQSVDFTVKSDEKETYFKDYLGDNYKTTLDTKYTIKNSLYNPGSNSVKVGIYKVVMNNFPWFHLLEREYHVIVYLLPEQLE